MAQRLSREDYHAWLSRQPPRRRFERAGGEAVAMAPERWAHARLKARVWQALDRAIRDAGLPCEAAPDGMTVEIGEDTDYEPDALVNCGPPIADDSLVAPHPVVVVEVLSPATGHIDAGIKLGDYFRVASIRHYLLIRTDRCEIIHHHRAGDVIETRIVTEGSVRLDPPGIALALDELYGR